MSKKLFASVAALAITFGVSVGMVQRRPAVAALTAGASATVAGLSAAGFGGPCNCSCGYDCDGTCIASAPSSCSEADAIACAIDCCMVAPYPDPACGHGPLLP